MCLFPAAVRVADQVGRQLLSERERDAGFAVSIDLQEWLRGSGAGLADMLSKLTLANIVTPDEARAFINLPVAPNGTGASLLRPVNMVPADAPAAPANPEPAAAAAPPPPTVVQLVPEKWSYRTTATGEPPDEPESGSPHGVANRLMTEAEFEAAWPALPPLPLEPEAPAWMDRMAAALEAGDNAAVELLLTEEVPPEPDVSENVNQVADSSPPSEPFKSRPHVR
jgi:hypothetical protein